jgi:antitoxin (DNA-binding transcriptional repressor) of toxin-antitoxin stability system
MLLARSLETIRSGEPVVASRFEEAVALILPGDQDSRPSLTSVVAPP